MYFFLEGGAGDYDKIVSKFVMNSQSMYLRYRTACSSVIHSPFKNISTTYSGPV